MGLTDNGWNDNQDPSLSLPCLTLSSVIQPILRSVAEHPWLRRAWEYTGGATVMTAWMTVSVALGMWSLPGSQNMCWTSFIMADSLLRKTLSTFSLLVKALFKQFVFIVDILEKTFPSHQPKQGK